jgi:hypothetical protein
VHSRVRFTRLGGAMVALPVWLVMCGGRGSQVGRSDFVATAMPYPVMSPVRLPDMLKLLEILVVAAERRRVR